MSGNERAGVLIVRAWIEDSSLRARITAITDVTKTSSESSRAAASVDQVCDMVRSWLEELIERGQSLPT